MNFRQWSAFLLVSVFSGSAFMWNKQALPELAVMDLLLYRFTIGTGFLVLMALATRQRWRHPPISWLSPVIMGAFNFATPHFFIAWGQQYVDSSLAGILITTTPLYTLFIAHALLRDDRLTLPKLGGAVGAFAGVVVIMSRTLGKAHPGTLLGQLSILLAAVSFGTSSVVGRRLAQDMSPIMQALVANVTAMLVSLAVRLLLPGPMQVPQLAMTWWALVFLGLFNSACMYPLFFYLLNSIGPTRTQMVTYLIPVIALLLGVVALGEPLYWQLLAGGTMIIGGIATVNYGSGKTVQPETGTGSA